MILMSQKMLKKVKYHSLYILLFIAPITVAQEFIHIPNGTLFDSQFSFGVDDIFTGSVEECKKECRGNSNCKSFDYDKTLELCNIFYDTATTLGGIRFNSSSDRYSHYMKVNPTTTEEFMKFPNAALSGYNNRRIDNISRAQCRDACRNESTYFCRTADYRIDYRRCWLSADSGESPATSPGASPYDMIGLVHSSVYDHYVREWDYSCKAWEGHPSPLGEFVKIKNRDEEYLTSTSPYGVLAFRSKNTMDEATLLKVRDEHITSIPSGEDFLDFLDVRLASPSAGHGPNQPLGFVEATVFGTPTAADGKLASSSSNTLEIDDAWLGFEKVGSFTQSTGDFIMIRVLTSGGYRSCYVPNSNDQEISCREGNEDLNNSIVTVETCDRK